jgi:hypothetical protein
MNPATRSLKRQQYVASTCLLASDHVCRLLKNVMLRDKVSERQAQAVAFLSCALLATSAVPPTLAY